MGDWEGAFFQRNPFIRTYTRRSIERRMSNTVVIMGDDVGWFNIRAYHRGIMTEALTAEKSGGDDLV